MKIDEKIRQIEKAVESAGRTIDDVYGDLYKVYFESNPYPGWTFRLKLRRKDRVCVGTGFFSEEMMEGTSVSLIVNFLLRTALDGWNDLMRKEIMAW